MNDLGSNAEELGKRARSSPKYKTFIDIGIRDGDSSRELLTGVEQNDGEIFGIDVANITKDFINHPKYTFIRGESVEIASQWNAQKADVIFIDTTHVDTYVLCELYYWWDLLNEGGIMALHDTEWPSGWRPPEPEVYTRHAGHVCEGVKTFFGVTSLDYEDDFISMNHYPNSFGMTFVTKKKNFD